MRSEIETNGILAIERPRWADYVTLTKPELTLLSVLTALGGFYLGAGSVLEFTGLLHTLLGTALVGGGVGALNQYLEREYDALMRRTENRPLPSGRLSPNEVLLFGTSLSIAGILDLALFTNVLSAGLALITLVTYLFLYTPLKRITWWSTIVGGIPGALPPLIGFAAARNDVTLEGWLLFAILFAWQMPHFFSLAWMYRKDYERAGYPMLTVVDKEGGRTATQILLYSLALLPLTIVLGVVSELGWTYALGSVVVSGGFVWYGIRLHGSRSHLDARKMFFASLLYLPVLFAFMVLDRI